MDFATMTEFQLADFFSFRPGDRKTANVVVQEDLALALTQDAALQARFNNMLAKLRAGGDLEGGPVQYCFWCKYPKQDANGVRNCRDVPHAPGKRTCGSPQCEAELAKEDVELARRASLTPKQRKAEDKANQALFRELVSKYTKPSTK